MFKLHKAIEKHGTKYDYSKVVYKNVDTKVVISCPTHGDFTQTPYHHVNRGQGCPKCRGKRIQKSKSLGVAKFVLAARQIHNNKYSYTQVVYYNAHTHVIITCPKHGDFSQTPNNHLYTANGCPSCGSNTSKPANKWLDDLNIPKLSREIVLEIEKNKYKVDAFHNNTIYGYFGHFWHGHPDFFPPHDINPKNKVSYGELYEKTLERINIFQCSSHSFIHLWGN